MPVSKAERKRGKSWRDVDSTDFYDNNKFIAGASNTYASFNFSDKNYYSTDFDYADKQDGQEEKA